MITFTRDWLTRMNNCFTNEASSDRILYGITQMLNKKWRVKTLKQISTI